MDNGSRVERDSRRRINIFFLRILNHIAFGSNAAKFGSNQVFENFAPVGTQEKKTLTHFESVRCRFRHEFNARVINRTVVK